MQINNQSEFVIVVSNNYFNAEIPAFQSITISEDDINNDSQFEFGFFSKKKKQTENEFYTERTLGNRYGIGFRSCTSIPMRTVVNVGNSTEIIVKDDSIEFHFLTLIFKTISLRKLSLENYKEKQNLLFVNDSEKRYFLKWLFIELLITFFLLLIMIPISVIALVNWWGWFECVLLCCATIFFVYSYCRKIYYFRLFKRLSF